MLYFHTMSLRISMHLLSCWPPADVENSYTKKSANVLTWATRALAPILSNTLEDKAWELTSPRIWITLLWSRQQPGLSLPVADLAYVICLQEHLPEQTEEEGRKALHRELSNNLILIRHRLPLPVFLLHIFFQVKATFLGYIILFEECLKGRAKVYANGHSKRNSGHMEVRNLFCIQFWHYKTKFPWVSQ